MKPQDNVLFKIFYGIIFISTCISIYFYYLHYFWLAVLFFLVGIITLIELNKKKIDLYIEYLNHFNEINTNSNIDIKFQINIEEVLKSKPVENLFERLKQNKVIAASNIELWIEELIEDYKKDYAKDNCLETVNFHIKNNNLWFNEKIYFYDRIIHRLYLGYRHDKNFESKKRLFIPNVERFLEIRVLIVNGCINLQIGNFDVIEYSPEIYNKDGMEVYKTYETITSFPLMYFSNDHNIPVKYLNFTHYDTESYKNHFKVQITEYDKKLKDDYFKDWRELSKDINDYNYLYSLKEFYANNKKVMEIYNHFSQKMEEILDKNGFVNLSKQDKYERRSQPIEVNYSNKYLEIHIADWNKLNDGIEKIILPDYYEQTHWL